MAEQTYVFTAELVDHIGVTRTVALRGSETLASLHELLRGAFEWSDDHLYSFWLDGEFWGDEESEYTSPVEAEPGAKTADVELDALGLRAGLEIAYLFDFGDEWRVSLRVDEVGAGGARRVEILERRGEAPPQYGAPTGPGLGEIAG